MSIQLVSRCRARGILFIPATCSSTRPSRVCRAAQHDGKELSLWRSWTAVVSAGCRWCLSRRIVEADNESRDVHVAAVSLPESIDWSGIVSTLSASIDHHDVLRSTVVHEESTGWGVEVAEPGSVDVAGLVRQVPLSADLDFESLRHRLHWNSKRPSTRRPGRRGNDPIDLVRFWVRAGRGSRSLGPSGRRRRDVTGDAAVAVGIRVVARRLDAPPQFEVVGTSMRRWAHALFDDARSVERIAELPRWVEELTIQSHCWDRVHSIHCSIIRRRSKMCRSPCPPTWRTRCS